ncbi:MAG: hypothetical protein JW940_25895 [Polyangiaceae bacterium]|nr:hypothetical protein [Polyangiaceae bacterium]
MRGKPREYLWGLLIAIAGTRVPVGLLMLGAASTVDRDLHRSSWFWAGLTLWFLVMAAAAIGLVARGRFETVQFVGVCLALVVLPLWGLALDCALRRMYAMDPEQHRGSRDSRAHEARR